MDINIGNAIGREIIENFESLYKGLNMGYFIMMHIFTNKYCLV